MPRKQLCNRQYTVCTYYGNCGLYTGNNYMVRKLPPGVRPLNNNRILIYITIGMLFLPSYYPSLRRAAVKGQE